MEDGTDLDVDFSNTFKELFCVAAQDLANQIHHPLETLGVLYEAPMETGIHPSNLTRKHVKIQARRTHVSTESGLESFQRPNFGKGQFLFVVRQVAKQDADSLSAAGFRFAAVPQIIELLSRNMQTSHVEMLARLEDIREYSTSENMIDPGVHVACFMLRPTVRNGFDVLVSGKTHNQLPTAKLPFESLSHWQMGILRRMDDWTLAAILKWLKGDIAYTVQYEVEFCHEIFKAVSQLAELIQDRYAMQAKFSARSIEAPCRPDPRSYSPGRCTFLCFRIITNIHARPLARNLTYIPLGFFKAQQQVYTGVTDHEAFARQVHREFGHCRGRRARSRSPMPLRSSSRALTGSPTSQWPLSPPRSSGGSMNPVTTAKGFLATRPSFGGIMVSNSVSVNVGELDHENANASSGVKGMGTIVEAGTAPKENKTFVDELYALCQNGKSIE